MDRWHERRHAETLLRETIQRGSHEVQLHRELVFDDGVNRTVRRHARHLDLGLTVVALDQLDPIGLGKIEGIEVHFTQHLLGTHAVLQIGRAKPTQDLRKSSASDACSPVIISRLFVQICSYFVLRHWSRVSRISSAVAAYSSKTARRTMAGMTKKKNQTLRFGCGSPADPWSQLWRLVAENDDVYISYSKLLMGSIKLSLHRTGQWNYAWTEQSGVIRIDRRTAKGGPDRRIDGWRRPEPYAPGLTLGPSIFVLPTSVGTRRLFPEDVEGNKPSVWLAPPSPGQMVEFNVHFVGPEAGPTISYFDAQMLGSVNLLGGEKVAILARYREAEPDFIAHVEKVISSNHFKVNQFDEWAGGSIPMYQTVDVSSNGKTVQMLAITDIPIQAVLATTGEQFVRPSGEPHIRRGAHIHINVEVKQKGPK